VLVVAEVESLLEEADWVAAVDFAGADALVATVGSEGIDDFAVVVGPDTGVPLAVGGCCAVKSFGVDAVATVEVVIAEG